MIPIAKPSIDQREIDAVVHVMKTGQLAQGKEVIAFESKYSNTFDVPFSIAVCSGTAALHVALLAAGLKESDKVLTTPFSFIATTNAILYCGAIPIFVDVDENSFNLSPEKLLRTLKEHPDAKYLLLVHLFGQPCEMDSIVSIAKDYGLTIIEDCAQAHGATYGGKPVGTFGMGGTFSFYPTKNMTTGEGGMIVSANEDFAVRCRNLINHGSTVRYVHDITGFNYRMTDISAAIGIVQLEKFHEFNTRRKNIAARYLAEIQNDYIKLPRLTPNANHVFHQFSVVTPFRDEFIAHLEQNGVGYGIYYPIPIHRQQNVKDYMKDKGFTIHRQPICEKLSEQVISIPVHPQLTDVEVGEIIEVINGFRVL